MNDRLIERWLWSIKGLEAIGGYVPSLGLRLILAYEFWVAGIVKYTGTNWFGEIQSLFPFPFNLLAPEISWQLATWFELIGALALVLGWATRFFSFSLMLLTIVAWASVHAGNGYNVSENGYKLPLLYLVMFIPLFLNGAGKASVDHFIWQRVAMAGKLIIHE